MVLSGLDTVADRNPALPLRTLDYGKYGYVYFLFMANVGFISSTVGVSGTFVPHISRLLRMLQEKNSAGGS